MVSNPLQILVENRGEELIANGIFADLRKNGRIEIVMCWVASSVVTFAQSSLLRRPDQPTAAILNCPVTHDANEDREAVVRILSRHAPLDAFCLALAIPDMTEWALTDPGFAAEIKRPGQQFDRRNKYDIAVAFKDWAASHTFDRGRLASRDGEFRGLIEFLTRVAQPASAD